MNSAYLEYKTFAKRHAIIMQVIRDTRDKYISTSEAGARGKVYSDHLPFNDREIDEVAIQEYIDGLLQEAASLEKHMSSYEFRRADGETSTQIRDPQQEKEPVAGKRKVFRRRS